MFLILSGGCSMKVNTSQSDDNSNKPEVAEFFQSITNVETIPNSTGSFELMKFDTGSGAESPRNTLRFLLI